MMSFNVLLNSTRRRLITSLTLSLPIAYFSLSSNSTHNDEQAPKEDVIEKYDYVVIGGGSGGISSAKRAAQLYNKKVLIVDKSRDDDSKLHLGGTCVNVGCVPKKMMFNASYVKEMMKEAGSMYSLYPTSKSSSLFNIFPNNKDKDDNEEEMEIKFNWEEFKRRRDAYVHRLNGIYERSAQGVNVDIAGFFLFWKELIDQFVIKMN